MENSFPAGLGSALHEVKEGLQELPIDYVWRHVFTLMYSQLVGAEWRGNASGFGRVKPFIHPATDEFEFTVHSGFRNIHEAGGFLGRKAEKKTELEHAAFTRVQFVELVQNARQIQQLNVGGANAGKSFGQSFVQRDRETGVPLLPPLAAGMVHQNSPHEARGEAVKVLAVLKAEAALAN